MRNTFFLCLSFAAMSFAQSPPYNAGREIIDAYERGVQARMMRERMELERKRLEMEKALQEERLRQMRLQTEATRLETERLQRESLKRQEDGRVQAKNQELQQGGASGPTEKDVRDAFAALTRTHGDWEAYAGRMTRLADLLSPKEVGAMTLTAYLESLYLVSKHASFAPSLGELDRAQSTESTRPGTVAAEGAVGARTISAGFNSAVKVVDCGIVSQVSGRIAAYHEPSFNSRMDYLTCGEKVLQIEDRPIVAPSGERYLKVKTKDGTVLHVNALWLR